MLNAMNNLRNGNIEDVDNKMLYPLLRWSSGNKNTLHQIQRINRLFFWVPQDLSKIMLSSVARYFPPYMKYPKPVKFSDKKYEVLAEVLKNKYNWSSHELLEQRPIIISLLDNQNYLQQLADESGMDDKERRKLGLKVSKAKKPEKKLTKTLFEF